MNDYEIRLRVDCLTAYQQRDILHEVARRHWELVAPLVPPMALIEDELEYQAGPDALRSTSLEWLRRLTREDRQALLDWLGGRKDVSELSQALQAARSRCLIVSATSAPAPKQ